MATAIGDLVVRLTGDTRHLDRTLRDTQRNVGGFQRNMLRLGAAVAAAGTAAAAAAAGGIAIMTRQSMQAIDATAKLADRVGASTEFITAMGFAAEQSGIEVSTMNSSMEKLARNLGDAAVGSGEASKTIKMLGLDAAKLAAMPLDDAFLDIADAIASLPTPAAQAAAAADLFGRSGVQLVTLLRGGAADVRAFVDEAERLNLTFSREQASRVEAANDAMNRFKRSVGSVGNEVAIALAPALTEMANILTALAQSDTFRTIISRLGTMVELGTRFVSGWSALRGIFGAVQQDTLAIASATEAINPPLEQALSTTQQIADANREWLESTAEAEAAVSDWLADMNSKLAELESRFAKPLSPMEQFLKDTRELNDLYDAGLISLAKRNQLLMAAKDAAEEPARKRAMQVQEELRKRREQFAKESAAVAEANRRALAQRRLNVLEEQQKRQSEPIQFAGAGASRGSGEAFSAIVAAINQSRQPKRNKEIEFLRRIADGVEDVADNRTITYTIPPA